LTSPIELDLIEQAADRIKDRVRRTPCLRTRYIRNPPSGARLMLKLECLQVTGSFKARGANNAILQRTDDELANGVVTASGGNHALAVAYAARASGVAARVYVPAFTSDAKIAKIKAWDADVTVIGETWDDANVAALEDAETSGKAYIHPFADAAVIAGQGTVGREMMKQSSDIDTVLVAIGGGGLISGVASAVKAIKPEARVIGVEPVGAPTLSKSLAAGEVVTLPGIDTEAGTLAPRRSDQMNLDIIRQTVDEIVLVNDDDMYEAARWLWFEMGVAAELSGAAGVAALMAGKADIADDATVCAVVCGAGADGVD